MNCIGSDKPLYVLSCDHRSSLQRRMFGWDGNLSPQQTAEIVAAKRLIYDAFKAAIQAGVPKDKAAILVDEQFGAAILREAAGGGYLTCCPAEKSGQDQFDFEYGDRFDEHIEAFQPAFCKVLVRYNPEGNQQLNQLQLLRLKRLSEYLHSNLGHSGFMLELLVPPEQAQLERMQGDKKLYDWGLRPVLTAQAMEQFQDADVEPDVWKIEGLERHEDCEKIVAVARRGTRHHVGCIIMGRGEDDGKVREWLATAAAVPGIVGFTAGRDSLWNPLLDWREKRITRDQAVAEVARRYGEYVSIFETSGKPVPA